MAAFTPTTARSDSTDRAPALTARGTAARPGQPAARPGRTRQFLAALIRSLATPHV
jgi:hypothetical protein